MTYLQQLKAVLEFVDVARELKHHPSPRVVAVAHTAEHVAEELLLRMSGSNSTDHQLSATA